MFCNKVALSAKLVHFPAKQQQQQQQHEDGCHDNHGSVQTERAIKFYVAEFLYPHSWWQGWNGVN